MTKNPKVSVIISTYNRAELLESRSIPSVLNQTFEDFEILVIDDGSTDHTKVVMESIDDPRVRYYQLPENFGKDTRPKNWGLVHARGEYVAYLDDDNEWLPNHLELLVTELDMDEDLDGVYCDYRVVDPNDPEGEPKPGFAKDFDRQYLLNRCYMDTSSTMHRREAGLRVGGWDERLPRFVDWNLWVRMVKAGSVFKYVPVFLTKYYLTPGNTAEKQPVKTWTNPTDGVTFFDPTWWDPYSCDIYGPWLEQLDPKLEQKQEKQPKVAIFMLTKDRADYTFRTLASLDDSTDYPYDLYVFDQGSKDENLKLLKNLDKTNDNVHVVFNDKNVGISKGSNTMLDKIFENVGAEIIIKIDNDVEFLTKGWIETIVDLWQMNHMLYVGPYPEGLVHNPGGAPRIGFAEIGPYYVEVTNHVSGLCVAGPGHVYKDFRWNDKHLHGAQDVEASNYFREKACMPCVVPEIRVRHMDGTLAQHEKYPEYFELRKKEKQETYED